MHGAGREFTSPRYFATACRRSYKVNGWREVLHRGVPLDHFRSEFLKDVPDVGGSHDLAVSRCPSFAKYGKAVELGSRSEVSIPYRIEASPDKGKGSEFIVFCRPGGKS
jgi:hypothetical protein